MAEFEWVPGGLLPEIDDHSIAKLRLFENYLDSYFPTVVRNPGQPVLKITIVDGFCGGGAYQSRGGIVDGSPFVLLNAVDRAQANLSAKRKTPFQLDAKFHFIDQDRRAVQHLRAELIRRGYLSRIGNDIMLHHGTFESLYPSIKAEIQSRTRKGRSIFVLDQKGYKDAPITVIRDILQNFPSSEILLTFAVDFLIDHMADTPAFHKAVSHLGITPSQVRKWLEEKRNLGANYVRYTVQRFLKSHLLETSGAAFISPFFLHSEKSAKDMWVVHLSHHPTARNVMVDSHYKVATISRHPGLGGLDMIGYDPSMDPSLVGEFLFNMKDVEQSRDTLRGDIEKHIREKHPGQFIRYSELIAEVANFTPARLDDISQVIAESVGDRYIQLKTQDGGVKRSHVPQLNDLISVAEQTTFLPQIRLTNK